MFYHNEMSGLIIINWVQMTYKRRGEIIIEIDQRAMDSYMGEITGILLSQEKNVVVTIASASMQPTIKVGTKVLCKSIKQTQVSHGDIIVYKQKYGNSIMIHRCLFVLPLKKKIYITKGDAFFLFDNPIPENRLYGVVEYHPKRIYDILFRKIQYVFLPLDILVTVIMRSFMFFRTTFKEFRMKKS